MLTYTAATSVHQHSQVVIVSVQVWFWHTRICFRFVNLANISILQGTPSADRAAAAATRGSTTDARNATVDMTGLPCWLKGVG